MEQNRLKYEEYCKAVEKLKSEGKNYLSIRATRAITKMGSNNTLMDMRARYLSEHPLPDGPKCCLSSKLLKDLEQEIETRAAERTRAYSQLRQLEAEANDEDAEICRELELRIAELEEQHAELGASKNSILEELKAVRIQAEEKQASADRRIGELLQAAADSEDRREKAVLQAQKDAQRAERAVDDLSKAEELLARRENELTEMRQNLDQARQEAAEGRAEVRELRKLGEVATTREKELRTEIQTIRDTLAAEQRENAVLKSRLERHKRDDKSRS